MREILFRGKRKDNGEWIVDNSVLFFTNSTKIYGALNGWREAEVIPETVGQYTGLTDKNGKKIFEGDIVNFKATAYYFKNCRIKYQTYYVRYCAIDNKGYEYPMDKNFEYEVIGNIHDNPELLRSDIE